MRPFLVHNAQEYEYIPAETPEPSPVLEPVPMPDGFVVGPEYNGRIARIRHDPVPRIPGAIVNEIEPMHGEDFRSKITYKLGLDPTWVDEFVRLNGQWIADRLFSEGVGWFDTGFPAFSTLDCGGNLVSCPTTAIYESGWIDVEYQRFQNGPGGIDYLKHPNLVTKQVLVTGTQTQTKILIDKGFPGGYGDTYIPKVSPVQPHHSVINRDGHNGLQFYPGLPCFTTLHGVQVTITRWCFYGSDTYGEIDGLWYLLEEMLQIGDINTPSLGGTMDDRRTYCAALAGMPCPPPVIGWVRQE